MAGYIVVIAICLMLSGFFSASETALLRIREHEVDEQSSGPTGAAALVIREMLSSTQTLLVTLLLGNNVVNILAASAASVVAVSYLGERLGVAVATVVLTLVVLVFCEVLPKTVAAHHPQRLAHAVALPVYVLHRALKPVHLGFERLVQPVMDWIAGDTEAVEPDTAESILRLARALPETQKPGAPLSIIQATAAADERTVGEIMVRRPEIIAYPVATSAPELLDAVLASSNSRIPVYEDSIDDILGIVHVIDLVRIVREGGADVRDAAMEPLRVPERKPILHLLADMQRSATHFAIVTDEFGVTQGIVTQEDILEELVGDIRDEFDRAEGPSIKMLPDGAYEVPGSLSVLDFNRETECVLEAERGDTIGGVILNTLGRQPETGDRVSVGEYTLAVARMSEGRIEIVRVEPGGTGAGDDTTG